MHRGCATGAGVCCESSHRGSQNVVGAWFSGLAAFGQGPDLQAGPFTRICVGI